MQVFARTSGVRVPSPSAVLVPTLPSSVPTLPPILRDHFSWETQHPRSAWHPLQNIVYTAFLQGRLLSRQPRGPPRTHVLGAPCSWLACAAVCHSSVSAIIAIVLSLSPPHSFPEEYFCSLWSLQGPGQ